MNESMLPSEQRPVCLIVEVMGAGEPTYIFDTDRTKIFASISRRRSYPDPDVTDTINKLVGVVIETADREASTAQLRDGSSIHVTAKPVIGPHNVVFAVQILLSRHEIDPKDDDELFRRAGAFMWNPNTDVTYHGLTMETQILGEIDNPQDERVSQEIFRNFQEMPSWTELGLFAASIQQQTCTNNDTFATELRMIGLDGAERQVFMTFRAHDSGAHGWVMRGVVHEISDIKPPKPATGFNAALVRTAFKMREAPTDSGIGHLNFPTGVITEWFYEPPEPLERWATEVPTIDDVDRERLRSALADLESGEMSAITLDDIKVRFVGTGWIGTRYDIQVASGGDLTQGLLMVTPVTPGPGSAPPLDPDSGILAW